MIEIAVLVVLALIAYEDFRFRAVRVLFFVALIILFLFVKLYSLSWLIFFSINIGFLTAVFLLTYLLLAIWKKKLFSPFQAIGLGDILFFIALAIWFDPVTFITFTVLSLVAALLLHTVLKSTSFYKHPETIPLAGIQGMCLAIILVGDKLVGLV